MGSAGDQTYHLIYASTAVKRLSQNELVELLKISRRNNEACGLTGMLLSRSGTYLQFLEGRKARVTEIMDRLQKDSRHAGIRVLREGNLSQRLFPEWSMAYKNLAGSRSANVPGYSELLQGHYVDYNSRGPARMMMEMFQEILVAA